MSSSLIKINKKRAKQICDLVVFAIKSKRKEKTSKVLAKHRAYEDWYASLKWYNIKLYFYPKPLKHPKFALDYSGSYMDNAWNVAASFEAQTYYNALNILNSLNDAEEVYLTLEDYNKFMNWVNSDHTKVLGKRIEL